MEVDIDTITTATYVNKLEADVSHLMAFHFSLGQHSVSSPVDWSCLDHTNRSCGQPTVDTSYGPTFIYLPLFIDQLMTSSLCYWQRFSKYL